MEAEEQKRGAFLYSRFGGEYTVEQSITLLRKKRMGDTEGRLVEAGRAGRDLSFFALLAPPSLIFRMNKEGGEGKEITQGSAVMSSRSFLQCLCYSSPPT